MKKTYSQMSEAEKQKHRDSLKKYAEKCKRENRCSACGKPLMGSGFVRCENCRKRINGYSRVKNRKNKKTVMDHYGGKCACCGEEKLLFLTIDHINGGGTKERIAGNHSSTTFYKKLIKENFPNGFQVLCFNCNCGRFVNGGICPHQEK